MIQEQGADNHGLQGNQKEAAPQSLKREKDNGNVENNHSGADGQVEQIVGDDGQTSDSTWCKICVDGKHHDADAQHK